MRRLLMFVVSAGLLSTAFFAQPTQAGPPRPARTSTVPDHAPGETPESIAQLWQALPPAAHARFFDKRDIKQTAAMPDWLGFGGAAHLATFCGFREDGKTSTRIQVRWAERTRVKRAISKLGEGFNMEGNVIFADLTRSQILAVAAVKGVTFVIHGGCVQLH